MLRTYQCIIVIIILLAACAPSTDDKPSQQNEQPFSVMAYYTGDSALIDSFPVEKLTHIIFSFCHLKGNRLSVDNARDTATIHKLVSLKKNQPSLKIILSLGGWGGCEFCSPVFASDSGRREFASSVREIMNYFDTDGIDLDWEYPAIEGYPGHAYTPGDRQNFTTLVRTLRDTVGSAIEINFAAGGFDSFLARSIEWDKVMPMLDKVNLMSYDLVNGYSKMTGHHTPLHITSQQKESADNAIRYLDSIGVPLSKVVIGAAFYAREWDNVPDTNNGLYQRGSFHNFIPYNQFDRWFAVDSGFAFFRDTIAMAPYAYSPMKKRFATFDDPQSISDKTIYALRKGLGGIMFWELTLDKRRAGLVDAIDAAIKSNKQTTTSSAAASSK
ncbi:MAG: glycoside hydrolase [Chitinophagaceae bacterium]|nr:glycoside hydrolase [Chitinophagaceae bacterium]